MTLPGGPTNPSRDDGVKPDAESSRFSEADRLLDAWFDREADERSGSRLRDAMRRDPALTEEFARTQRMLSMLKRPVASPDVSKAVLSRVGRRRVFLPAKFRRLVTSGRAAMAAALLAGLLTVALIHRASPDALAIVPRSTPVARVMDASHEDLAQGARQLTEALRCVPRDIVQPAIDVAVLVQRQGDDVMRTRLEVGPMRTVVLLHDATCVETGPMIFSEADGSCMSRERCRVVLVSPSQQAGIVPLGFSSPLASSLTGLGSLRPGENPLLVPSLAVLPGPLESIQAFGRLIGLEPSIPTAPR